MDNDAYRKIYDSMTPSFLNYNMTVIDIFEDDKDNKVVVRVDATADTVVGPYSNEKMLMFYFNDSGKISRALEFIDSAKGMEFFGKLQQLMASTAAVESEKQ
jgi:hypothetical protein